MASFRYLETFAVLMFSELKPLTSQLLSRNKYLSNSTYGAE